MYKKLPSGQKSFCILHGFCQSLPPFLCQQSRTLHHLSLQLFMPMGCPVPHITANQNLALRVRGMLLPGPKKQKCQGCF